MFIFDTSSLISLVRYYLPFDRDQKLYNHIRLNLTNLQIILIDAVLEECRYTSRGLVLKRLDFLSDKEFLKAHNLPVKTDNILPPSPRKFYNMVDSNFTTPRKNILTPAQYEQLKKEFLNSADCRMILFALNTIHHEPRHQVIIVTEETEQSNDQKAFKKLPTICRQINLQTMTLPDYIDRCEDLNMIFH